MAIRSTKLSSTKNTLRTCRRPVDRLRGDGLLLDMREPPCPRGCQLREDCQQRNQPADDPRAEVSHDRPTESRLSFRRFPEPIRCARVEGRVAEWSIAPVLKDYKDSLTNPRKRLNLLIILGNSSLLRFASKHPKTAHNGHLQ
jgi:hypothetical protein